jgi:hypothetical protein
VASPSINSLKLEGELQFTLGLLGQFLLTKMKLFKLIDCKQHLFKFVNVLAKWKKILNFYLKTNNGKYLMGKKCYSWKQRLMFPPPL